MQHNHSYNQTTPTQPSVQYSSLGPRDTPTGHAHPQGGEERVYHVLEQPEREGEYQEIEQEGEGMAYEVPVQSKSQGGDTSAGRTVEMAYSTLQHT